MRALVIIWTLLLPLAAYAQADVVIRSMQAQPVSADKLQGSTLVDKELGFRLPAPAPSWRWLVARRAKLTTYLCHHPQSKSLLLLHLASPLPLVNDENIEGFFAGMGRGTENKGGKMEGFKSTRPETPLAAEARVITYELALPQGGKLPKRQIVVFAHETFLFDHPLGAKDPRVLDRFVAGLELDPPGASALLASALMMLVLVLPLGLFLLLALIFRRRRARRIVRSICFAFMLVLFAGVVWMRIQLARSPSAYEAGVITGQLSVFFIAFAVVYLVVTRFFVRAKSKTTT